MVHGDPCPSTKESAATPVSPPRPPRWLREEPTKMQARSRWRTGGNNEPNTPVQSRGHWGQVKVSDRKEWYKKSLWLIFFFFSFLFCLLIFFVFQLQAAMAAEDSSPFFPLEEKLLQPNSCRKKSENTPFKPRGLGIKRKQGKQKASKEPLSKKVYRT